MGDTLYTVDMADIAIYLSEKVGNVSKKKNERIGSSFSTTFFYFIIWSIETRVHKGNSLTVNT